MLPDLLPVRRQECPADQDAQPGGAGFVLYRDIRTYGLLEDYYTEAREQRRAVLPVRAGKPAGGPKPSEDGLAVTFTDHVLGRNLRCLPICWPSAPAWWRQDTEELASIVKLARTAEGYFMEAHVKLRPVDMATDGILSAAPPTARNFIRESIAQALAAASRATTFLSQRNLTLSAVTARVDDR